MRGAASSSERLIAACVVSVSAWIVIAPCVSLLGLPVPVALLLWVLALGIASFVVAGAEA